MPDWEAEWEALRHGIDGDVVLPGSSAYEWARRTFIARFDEIKPQALVRCTGAGDVAEVLTFARRHGIATATRCGGHSLAGYSSTEGIVIDVTPMDAVRVSDGVAEVGAGARLGDLYERLDAHGVTIAGGTCPTVGIAGLTLGGGLGLLGRRHGLTVDNLLGARVVLADGSVVSCDEGQHPDLFWALRGAGAGNFGVVVSFTFRPLPAHPMTNFRLVWPSQHAASAIAAWQGWAPYAPDELSADLVISASGTDPAEVEIYGALLGTEGDASALLGDLVDRVGADPTSTFCSLLSYAETVRYQGDLCVGYDQVEDLPQGRLSRQGHRYTTSEFFDRPLPGAAIGALLDRFGRSTHSRSLSLAPWGGAYNRRAPTATAFAHRDQLFLLEHFVVVDPATSDQEKRAAHAWARASWESVHPWGSGRVFPNFPDPHLSDWGQAYYGQNFPRLCAIKARYDPGNVFRFPQSLPTAL